MTKRWRVLLGVLVGLFVLITLLVVWGHTAGFDAYVYDLVMKVEHDIVTSFMKVYTNVGGVLGLVVICLIFIYFFRKEKYAYLLPINLVSVFLLNNVFKLLIGRERPSGVSFITESGFSFPSGHSMVCAAFYGYLAYLLCKRFDRRFRPIIWVVCVLLVLLVGVSRIYLGVHYATDVIGGFVVAMAYLLVFIFVSEK